MLGVCILEAQNHRFLVVWHRKLIESNHTRRKKKNPALEMNIYPVSGGWGGCTGLDVIEETTKEKT